MSIETNPYAYLLHELNAPDRTEYRSDPERLEAEHKAGRKVLQLLLSRLAYDDRVASEAMRMSK